MTDRPSLERRLDSIGCRTPRYDALAKATGVERFAADHYPENLVWAGVKRSGVAHGLLRSIDVSAARALPGVIAAITGTDVPGSNRQGVVHKDQPVLAVDRIRHRGEPLALVVARDREVLRNALEAITADIEPLPGLFDPDAALAPGAPALHPGGNLLQEATIEKGRGAGGLDRCEVRLEGRYDLPFVAHAFLETENGVAWQESDGRIVMVVATQSPFRDRFEVGHALGLPIDRLRVVAPHLGGGFGGKDGATVQCYLALAAMKTGGRPVKMWWDREESFVAGYKRHAMRVDLELGADRDGTLRALRARLVLDTGAYAHLGGEVMALAMEHATGPYRFDDVLVEGRCVYTNNPIAGAMRGFGVYQTAFAIEGMIDRLAARQGVDPLGLRLKNAVRRGDANGAGVPLTHSTGLVECLEAASRHPFWTSRDAWKSGAGPFKRRGVGVASMYIGMGYGRGFPDSAIARLELTPAGTIRIHCGIADMGQGNASTFVQIAGDLLEQDRSHLELVLPDTDRARPSGSSSASRTTFTFAKALEKACATMRSRLLHWAALVLFVDDGSGLALAPGRVVHRPSGRELPLARLASFMDEIDRNVVDHAIAPVVPHPPPTGRGFKIGFPHCVFSHAAHVARVEVDTLTGCVEVVDYLAVSDTGRTINPDCQEQQVQGGVAQGLGGALMEQVVLQEGRIANPTCADYVVPTALDVPDIATIAVEPHEHAGPFGMKGAGEIGILGPLPTIASAIDDATGRRLDRAPFTPQRVLGPGAPGKEKP